MNYDYLIVGQGLAGSLLSYNLLEHNKKVLVVDDGHKTASTKVAAGLINPIIGKRYTFSPDFNQHFSAALKTYRALEQKFTRKIFYPFELVRVFRDQEDLGLFEHQQTRLEQSSIIKTIHAPGFWSGTVHDPFGSVTIHSSGYCDTTALLTSIRQYLISQKIFIKQPFSYDDVMISPECLTWHGHQFKKIIFCEGFQASQNPWFKTIPFIHAKGEILTLQNTDNSLPDKIFSNGKWLIPTKPGLFKSGSIYNWDQLDLIPTTRGREEILKQLSLLAPLPWVVQKHQAGIRPICKDQQPVIGPHSQHPSLYIFNGLGSKGTLLCPFLADNLTRHLCRHTKIIPTADIKRFYKKMNELPNF